MRWEGGSPPKACTLPLCHFFPHLSCLQAVGAKHLQGTGQWLALPSTLKHLHCYNLPPNLQALFSQGLSLRGLQTLHTLQPIQAWGVEELSALLDAMPELHTLSAGLNPLHVETIFPKTETIVIGGSITMGCLLSLQTLCLRLEAGLLVNGHFALRCGQDPIQEGAARIPLECLFSKLRAFPRLVHCQLLVGPSPLGAECLSQMARVFPNIKTLVLQGMFKDAHVFSLASCSQLQKLELAGVPLLSVVGMIRCMVLLPQIKQIRQPPGADIKTAELRTLMEIARSVCVGPVSTLVHEEWMVEHQTSDNATATLWVRRETQGAYELADSTPVGLADV